MNAHSRPLLPDSAVVSQVTRHGEFARLCRVLLLSGSNNFPLDLDIVRNGSERLQLAAKAAVAAGSLVSNDALIAYEEVGRAWLQALRHASVFDALLPDMLIVPMHQRFAISTTALVAPELAEGQGTPVKALHLAAATPLEPRKCAAIAVVSRELARTSEAEQLVDAELRGAVASGTDVVFLAALLAATTPVASTGMTADLDAMLAAVPVSKRSRLHWVFTPNGAKALATARDTSGARLFPDASPTGGELYGFPAEVTDQLAANTGLLVDAQQIGANGGSVEVDTATSASVEMADPSSLSGVAPVTGTALVSLWQGNQIGLKATRYFAFQVLRAEGIAAVSGIAWGTTP